MRTIGACAIAIGLGACGPRSPAPTTAATPATPGALVRIPVDTANGLSGLALDDTGAVWVVAERDATAYRIVLDPAASRVISTTAYPVDGVPPDTDLEALAWLGPDRLAVGVEGHAHGAARVYLADVVDGHVRLGRAIELPQDLVGLPIADNDGVEGVCGHGDVLYASIESNARDDRGRWAPVVRVELATGATRVTQVGLTSEHGKLSALDCAIDADGTAHLLAIERHFDVSHVITVDVPADAAPGARIAAQVARDLDPLLHGELNLEGIAPLPDGRWLTVVDNQYDKITGPDLLVVVPRS